MMNEPKPFAWVLPGDDTARDDGFIDAMVIQQGEFSKPLYTAAALEALAAENAELRGKIQALVEAKALAGVRGIVAGWNGENRPEPYNERHPYKLGASLPKTCCGHVYELDEALQAARAALSQQNGVRS
jgi:hypothetical protein